MKIGVYYRRALVGDGGPTQAMWSWASALASAGNDIVVLHGGVGTSGERYSITTAPVRHVSVGRVTVPRIPRELVRDLDLVILHSAFSPENVLFASALRRMDVPYMVVPHGAYSRASRDRHRAKKAAWMPIERRYLERAHAVHLFFESEARDLFNIAPMARAVVAPTGVVAAPSPWTGGGNYAAWIGRYDVHHKGIDLLFDALSYTSLPERLVLHGRDSKQSRHEVESLARERRVAARVTVGPAISGTEKARFLSTALAHVHPSRWESHSLAVLESLFSGAPTLVSSRTPIAHDLKADGAAIVCDPTSPHLASNLREVCEAGADLGIRGREFAARNFAWQAVTHQLLDQLAAL